MFGEKLGSEQGDASTVDVLAEADVVGIYFSAYWCPPCRGFTPAFAGTYNKVVANGGKFRVVFVSSVGSRGCKPLRSFAPAHLPEPPPRAPHPRPPRVTTCPPQH